MVGQCMYTVEVKIPVGSINRAAALVTVAAMEQALAPGERINQALVMRCFNQVHDCELVQPGTKDDWIVRFAREEDSTMFMLKWA